MYLPSDKLYLLGTKHDLVAVPVRNFIRELVAVDTLILNPKPPNNNIILCKVLILFWDGYLSLFPLTDLTGLDGHYLIQSVPMKFYFFLLFFFFFMTTQLQIKGDLKFQSLPTPELLFEVQYRLFPWWDTFAKTFFKNPARVVLYGVGILRVWDVETWLRSQVRLWGFGDDIYTGNWTPFFWVSFLG